MTGVDLIDPGLFVFCSFFESFNASVLRLLRCLRTFGTLWA